MKSLAKLQRGNDLSMFSPDLAERIYRAVERDLQFRYYAELHSDARIDGIEMCGTPDGEQCIHVTVAVTRYPSRQQWDDYYSQVQTYSQYVLSAPQDFTMTHTVEVGR